MARTRIVEEIIAGRKGDNSTCWTCGKSGHIAASCPNSGNENLIAVGQEESEISEQAVDKEEELQARCLLEESVSRGKKWSAERTNKN